MSENKCDNKVSCTSIDEEGNDAKQIDNSALKLAAGSDEDSLQKALRSNPFKLTLIRNIIKLKNHISTIPFLMAIACMVIITFTIPYHVNSIVKLHNEDMNAFYFFCNVLLSLLAVLTYMNASSKKSSLKKKIIMSVLFYIIAGFEIWLDVFYLNDIQIETHLYNSLNQVSDDAVYHYIANSQNYTYVHIICLIITVILAFIEPFLQPLIKKIHIRVA